MNEIWKNMQIEDLPGEEWRDIPGYEGVYQASNLGRIKTFHRKTPRILKPYPRKMYNKKRCGYLMIWLRFKGSEKNLYVHRLIASAWIENKNSLPCVDHINRDRRDNRACNLRYVTHKENSENGNTKSVYCLELDRTFNSVANAGDELGIFPQGISMCCRGKISSYKKMHWRYSD